MHLRAYDATMGGNTQDHSWNVLKPGGILVAFASKPSAETAAAHGVRPAFVITEPKALQRLEITRLVDIEKPKAIIETVFPLSDAVYGQELSKRRHTRGKIVPRVV